VTSQGQRFRRRALRRGYKVDEVDAFLDRVEATLAGDPIGAPVTAQEVHDVVFRVRFGGYDEWQVDLHLDRVERQLGDMEERGGAFVRQSDSGMGRSDRLSALRDEPLEPRRPSMAPPPMPMRPMPAPQMSGPPMMGGMAPPMSAPPMSGPPMPPMPPLSAPPPLPPRPMSAPPMSGPPMSGPPMSAPRPMSAPNPVAAGYSDSSKRG
jgi:DivIVA domain-containing protein